MARFLFSRLLQSIAVLFAIFTVTFILVRLAPGNPFQQEKAIPKHIMEETKAYYGTNKPVLYQYFKYLGNYLRLDFGKSWGNKGYTVREVIAKSFPVSLAIGLGGLIFSLLIGVPTGVMAAVKRNTWVDYALMSIALFGICLPTFIVGPLFSIVFGIELKWLPALGWRNTRWDWFLPALTLGWFYGAYIARLARAGMLETLSQDFVRTARSKGLPESTVVLKHALKGGLVPVVSYIGPAIAGMIGGSFVIETIFLIPGLGTQFILAATNRDTPLILGTVMTFGVLILIMNFISDLLLGLLNPRQRMLEKSSEA